MSLRKLLILRRPPPGPRFARPEDRLRGRLEGRTTLNPGTPRFADSLFRGGDGEEKTRLICLVCTSSKQGSGSRIVKLSTKTGGFAADLLQVQPSATIGSIHDCRLEHTSGATPLLLAGEGKALTRNAADLGAMAAVAGATAQGAVTPREAMQLGQVFEAYVRAVEATEFERRLRVLEAANAPSP